MAALLHRKLRLGGVVRSFWSSLKHDIFDTYRPELHYMRGPGPKWNAKHRPAPYRRSPAQCDCAQRAPASSPAASSRTLNAKAAEDKAMSPAYSRQKRHEVLPRKEAAEAKISKQERNDALEFRGERCSGSMVRIH
jgi:hypothetical protein